MNANHNPLHDYIIFFKFNNNCEWALEMVTLWYLTHILQVIAQTIATAAELPHACPLPNGLVLIVLYCLRN